MFYKQKTVAAAAVFLTWTWYNKMFQNPFEGLHVEDQHQDHAHKR